jgi:glycerol uptake facilitator-like aquaporin
MTVPLPRRLVAEAVGTGFLLIAVVGSGIMAQRLSSDSGLQLLENAIATGAALVALILVFAPISGAHFNPAVTLVALLDGAISRVDAIWFVIAQVVGSCAGTIVANVMFDHSTFELSITTRSSGRLWLSEVVATLGLLLVIFCLVRGQRAVFVPFAVGAWITGAYWFTASTSFANPAVTVGRMLTNSFSGIRPSSAPMFIVMQLIGAALAIGLLRVLYPREADNG